MDKHTPKTKQVFDNYEIIIEIEEPWILDKDPQKAHETWKAKLATVIADINRHVDGCMRINPHWNKRNVCIYCESEPEPDPETGAPFCCDKAVADYEAAHEKAGSDGT